MFYPFLIFQNDWKRHIVDLLSVWQRWIVAAIFVIVHTAIVFGLSVPGCPKGTVYWNFVLVVELYDYNIRKPLRHEILLTY